MPERFRKGTKAWFVWTNLRFCKCWQNISGYQNKEEKGHFGDKKKFYEKASTSLENGHEMKIKMLDILFIIICVLKMGHP